MTDTEEEEEGKKDETATLFSARDGLRRGEAHKVFSENE